MLDIEGTRAAIREEGLDGWLFLTLHHRDEIADAALGIAREKMNTRPWAYLIAAEGPPAAIVHEIEPTILDHLPGRSTRYHARAAFINALAEMLPRGSRIAAQFSPDIPVGSFLDHGTALLLQGLGVALVSSANLVARCLGALDSEAVRSHEAAAAVLYAAVLEAWARIAAEIGRGAHVREGDVQGWIADRIAAAGLVSEGAPLVAAGANSANPHYESAAGGVLLEPGDVVQFDVWAREDSPAAVYADISWVGVVAREPTAQQRAAFDAVVQARETAIDLISRSFAEGREVRGRDVDEAARACLERLGFASAVRHRTGHAIGHRVHGYGVNLDCIEFPDNRPLREGACFSIEPGIYLERFGMRTEVDGLIRGGALSISGADRQRALLTLG
jgi:Xaa-Pro dipeptidase